MIIYGLKNCDVTRKALNWLEENGIAYTFHDYKEKGITGHKIEEWLKHRKLEELVNTRGTTYKALTDAEKEIIASRDIPKTKEIIIANTSIIKRPLVETGKEILLGFNEEIWDTHL